LVRHSCTMPGLSEQGYRAEHPAGTVTTNREPTNAPLVVRGLDDALLAAIELHDPPAPDDERTPSTPGAGCPLPEETINVIETAADIPPGL
jgi:hypothetical protein